MSSSAPTVRKLSARHWFHKQLTLRAYFFLEVPPPPPCIFLSNNAHLLIILLELSLFLNYSENGVTQTPIELYKLSLTGNVKQ